MTSKKPIRQPAEGGKDLNLLVGVAAQQDQQTVTARKAGTLIDMMLPVSPKKVPVQQALEHLAKAINLALQSDFLETELDEVYKAARVRKGVVVIQHRDYFGLGDGLFAKFGKAARSIQLTLRGPDPASPEGKAWIEKHGGKSPVKGFINLIGRKLDVLQEFEDKVPTYVEQMLDRLEAARMITGWNRSEWQIRTAAIGLDITIEPHAE
jgi:hypothetical protein